MNREFEIFEAVNGKDALEWLEQNRVDILLTDIKMPFMNGIELLEQVSVKYPEIKKLIFSGYGEFEYARQAMRFGVEEYILKPVDPAEFKNVMQKIVDGLDSEKKEENRKAAEVSFFKEYVLNAIVNGAGIEEVERRARDCYDLDFLNGYRRLMLLETDTDFFVCHLFLLFVYFSISPSAPCNPVSKAHTNIVAEVTTVKTTPVFLSNSFFVGHETLFNSCFVSLM